MKKNKTVGFTCLGLLLLLGACKENRACKAFPSKPLCQGDIVFRRGTGLASRAVLTVDAEGAYSHVGVVVNDRGAWKVIHAVPGESGSVDELDKLKMEDVDAFFAADRAVAGAVMRTDADSLTKVAAVQRAIRMYRDGVLFDHNYDKEDTTEMYCSELVEFIYARSGLDLTGGRASCLNMPGFSGLYLLPGDIQRSVHLRLVESF